MAEDKQSLPSSQVPIRFFQDIKLKKDSKRIINIPPFPINFTGRDEALNNLDTILQKNNSCALTSKFAGVGKTYLARAYVHKHTADYDLIFWINFDSLDIQLRNLASQLGMNHKELSMPDIINFVFQNLEEIPRWLIIIDNVTNYEELKGLLSFVSKSINSSFRHHMIITSTTQNIKHMTPLPLDEFTTEEALQLIKKMLPTITDVNAQKLRTAMHNNPLGIVMATSYLRERPDISIDEYLKLLLNETVVDTKEYSGTKPAYTAIKIVIAKLEKINQKSLYLLYMCAYLQPDRIPITLLIIVFDQFDDSLLSILQDYSLINVDEEKKIVRIHKLTQTTLQSMCTSNGTSNTILTQLLTRICHYVKELNQNEVESWHNIIPHVFVVQEHAKKTTPCFQILADILFYVGKHLTHKESDCYGGSKALTLALTYYEHSTAVSTTSLAAAHYELANALRDQESQEKALPEYEKALQFYSNLNTTNGSHRIQIAQAFAQMGAALSGLGRHCLALEKYEAAIKLYTDIYRELEPASMKAKEINERIAWTNIHKGNALHDLGRFNDALAAHDMAFRLYRGVKASQAWAQIEKGADLYALGLLDEAKNEHRKAVKTWRLIDSEEHPRTMWARNYYGADLCALGFPDQALLEFEATMSVFEKLYFDAHSNLGYAHYHIGIALRLLGQYTSAIAEHLITLKIYEKCRHGKLHPDIGMTYIQLALDHIANNNETEALKICGLALTIFESIKNRDNYVNPMIAYVYLTFSMIYFSQNKEDKMISHLKTALSIGEKSYANNFVTMTNVFIKSAKFSREKEYHHELVRCSTKPLPLSPQQSPPSLIARKSKIKNDLTITQDLWVVSILRKPEGISPEHAFLVIEGTNKYGNAIIWKFELVIDNEKKGMSKIIIKPEQGNDEVSPENDIILLLTLTRHERVIFLSWPINQEKAIELRSAVEKDQTNPPKYLESGNQSVFAHSSHDNDVHNCFTWAREKLINLKLENIYKDLVSKHTDWIAVLPSLYLPDNKRFSNQITFWCKIIMPIAAITIGTIAIATATLK